MSGRLTAAIATMSRNEPPVIRRRIVVEGIVQGVGFRPFVFTRAVQLGLAGHVANDVDGVVIEIEGYPDRVTDFLDQLAGEIPPLAHIEGIQVTPLVPSGGGRFTILASHTDGARRVPIGPDVATCGDCLRELFDPHDRRYRYPFINCTNCGPRFTIVRGVPYDRPLTTMAAFQMCAACLREYEDPADRRFHAQPIACPDCGPRLRLLSRSGDELAGDPIDGAIARLRAGSIVAVKGIGGYHFAAAANDDHSVSALRSRKHREDKPFAVMIPDLAAAARLATLDDAATRALRSLQRPVVLLPRRAETNLAPSVAPRNRQIGLLLPYTPVHHLLLAGYRQPLVLTSGNVSDEPIAFDDDDALNRLACIADAFLTHGRRIHTRSDDSVVRVHRGRALPVRRARGYAPQPLLISSPAPRPILACGAELKNTFCLLKGRRAYLSHHIGDLENYATLRSFTDGITHFRELFDVAPAIVAHDLHPEYLSTKFALDLGGVERVGVQHHHAHIAACLADNAHAGPVIGVAFDGLGYGLDGTLWGGEFLIADTSGFVRAAHLVSVPMPGGSNAIRQPWRMAAAYLARAFGKDVPDLAVVRRNRARWEAVTRLAATPNAAPLTSSVGRLFDAVAAILGVRDDVHYEGQAAIELEQLADPTETGAYPIELSEGELTTIDGADIVRSVVNDAAAGAPVAVTAARVHNTLAHVVVEVSTRLRQRAGLSTVALSGGVFQNLLLLERVEDGLAARGFRVLTHARVPCNDGGISFGQAVVAAARCRNAHG